MIARIIEFLSGLLFLLLNRVIPNSLAHAIESACIPLPSEIIMPFPVTVSTGDESGRSGRRRRRCVLVRWWLTGWEAKVGVH